MDQRTPETTPNYTLNDGRDLDAPVNDKGFVSRNQQQEFHTLLAIIVSYNFYQTFSYQIPNQVLHITNSNFAALFFPMQL